MAVDQTALAGIDVAYGVEQLPRRPLSIALASPYDYAFPGGVTQHVRALARCLRARGHHVGIIAPTSTPLPEEEGVIPLGVSVQAVPMSGAVARVSLVPTVWRAVRDALRQQACHVLHHDGLADVLGQLLRDQTGRDVGRAAGRNGHHDGNLARRVLRPGAERGAEENEQRRAQRVH